MISSSKNKWNESLNCSQTRKDFWHKFQIKKESRQEKKTISLSLCEKIKCSRKKYLLLGMNYQLSKKEMLRSVKSLLGLNSKPKV
jgi:hypothetical protein